MLRNIRTTLCCMAALLLLTAGCNDKGKQSKSVNTANIKETAPSLTAVPEAESRETTSDEEAMLRNDSQREELRTELLAMLPEYEYTYNADSDKVGGPGMPDAGIPVTSLIDMLDKRLQKTASNPGKAEYQQVCRLLLTQFQSAGQSSDRKNIPTEKLVVEQDPEKQADAFGLKKAPKVYGEWRSVREEGEKYTVEHDDQYYKQLLVYYDGDTMYSSFAKGQQIKNDVFDYTYDKNLGELQLKEKQGRFTMKLRCFVRDSEPGMLYVQQQAGQAYTVYEKIGRGEEPMTDEELQDFLDLQKEISGGDGGTAKKGK